MRLRSLSSSSSRIIMIQPPDADPERTAQTFSYLFLPHILLLLLFETFGVASDCVVSPFERDRNTALSSPDCACVPLCFVQRNVVLYRDHDIASEDDYCKWGTAGVLIVAASRFALHQMEDQRLALRITQGFWLTFVALLPLTGLTYPLPTDGTPWTIDRWVHDMHDWSSVVVLGMLFFGAFHGLLLFKKPLLLASASINVFSCGGTSLMYDMLHGEPYRDGMSIAVWLFAYGCGLALSSLVIEPFVCHLMRAEERAENLLCSKERLLYDLNISRHQGATSVAACIGSPLEPQGPGATCALVDSKAHLTSHHVRSSCSESEYLTAYTAADDLSHQGDQAAGPEAAITSLSAVVSPAAVAAEPTSPPAAEHTARSDLMADGNVHRPSSQSGTSHCSASSCLTIEHDVKRIEQHLFGIDSYSTTDGSVSEAAS